MTPASDVAHKAVARRDLLAILGSAAAGFATTGAAFAQSPPTASPNEPQRKSTVALERLPGGVLLVGIDRPEAQNRIDVPTFIALGQAYYQLEHDDDLRVAVLHGRGADFPQGLDLQSWGATLASGPLNTPANIIDPLGASGADRSKPLLVAVQGHVTQIAHELFLAADVRVAARDAVFNQGEATAAQFPGGGATIRFVRKAGWDNAMRYMLTGDDWHADDAQRMGLVLELTTAGQQLDRAIELAKQMTAAAPLGVRAVLASAHRSLSDGEKSVLAALQPEFVRLDEKRGPSGIHPRAARGTAPRFMSGDRDVGDPHSHPRHHRSRRPDADRAHRIRVRAGNAASAAAELLLNSGRRRRPQSDDLERGHPHRGEPLFTEDSGREASHDHHGLWLGRHDGARRRRGRRIRPSRISRRHVRLSRLGESDARLILAAPEPAERPDDRFAAEVIEPREILDPLAEVEDLSNVIDWMQAEPQSDTSRIGLWGTSLGGGIAAYVAGYDHRVKALHVQAAPLELRALDQLGLADGTKRACRELGYPQPGLVVVSGLRGAAIAGHFLSALFACTSDEPRAGLRDAGCPRREGRAVRRSARHRRVSELQRHEKNLVTIPDITHYDIYGKAREHARQLARAWFDEYLKP